MLLKQEKAKQEAFRLQKAKEERSLEQKVRSGPKEMTIAEAKHAIKLEEATLQQQQQNAIKRMEEEEKAQEDKNAQEDAEEEAKQEDDKKVQEVKKRQARKEANIKAREEKRKKNKRKKRKKKLP